MKQFFACLLIAFALINFNCSLWSQTATDLNEGIRLTHDSGNDTWTFSWWGRSGITYFIQKSDDLMSWQYAPVIKPGQDGVVEWNFDPNADKLFMRLNHTDKATVNPFDDDFDGDGISNINEVTAPSELNLDPFDPDSNDNGTADGFEDTDGDLMLNGEELANGLNPLVNDAMSDLDGDGYPNIYEVRNPNGAPNDASAIPGATFVVSMDGSTDYTTLQSAIDDAALDYSIILVKPGIYTGSGNPDFSIAVYNN